MHNNQPQYFSREECDRFDEPLHWAYNPEADANHTEEVLPEGAYLARVRFLSEDFNNRWHPTKNDPDHYCGLMHKDLIG